jgi:hypothetical protein
MAILHYDSFTVSDLIGLRLNIGASIDTVFTITTYTKLVDAPYPTLSPRGFTRKILLPCNEKEEGNIHRYITICMQHHRFRNSKCRVCPINGEVVEKVRGSRYGNCMSPYAADYKIFRDAEWDMKNCIDCRYREEREGASWFCDSFVKLGKYSEDNSGYTPFVPVLNKLIDIVEKEYAGPVKKDLILPTVALADTPGAWARMDNEWKLLNNSESI